MKKTHSQSSATHQKSDSACIERDQPLQRNSHSKTMNITPLNLNGLTSNSSHQLDSGMDTNNYKGAKSSSSQNYEKQFFRLSGVVKDMFLELKHRTREEVSQNLIPYNLLEPQLHVDA
jgi:hypothetical protein